MHEPYVADPAEPPRRRMLAQLQPTLWTIIIVLLVVGAATLLLQGYGEEDPALEVPSDQAP